MLPAVCEESVFLWSSVFRFYISFLVKPFKASPVMETSYTHSNDFDRSDSPGRSTIKMIRNEPGEILSMTKNMCQSWNTYLMIKNIKC